MDFSTKFGRDRVTQQPATQHSEVAAKIITEARDCTSTTPHPSENQPHKITKPTVAGMQQWNGGRPDFEGTHRPFPSEDQQKENALSTINWYAK
jgi:hypothetical protein